jgi:hypothetical protein
MRYQKRARPLGARLGDCHRRLASDNRVSPPKSALNQERSRALPRRQRLVEHLHWLGPVPLGQFIREIEVATGADVTARLEIYAKIDPEFVRALGGDQFALLVHVIDESGP